MGLKGIVRGPDRDEIKVMGQPDQDFLVGGGGGIGAGAKEGDLEHGDGGVRGKGVGCRGWGVGCRVWGTSAFCLLSSAFCLLPHCCSV